MKGLLRKLTYSFTEPHRVVVIDYPVIPSPLYTPETKPHQALYSIISHNDGVYEELLGQIPGQINALKKLPVTGTAPNMPSWENGFFPAFDAIMLYTIIKQHKPKQYVEIGSGNSTKMAGFCRTEEGMNFKITCIDPHPRREIKEIADQWISQSIQSVSLSHFIDLLPNDIVFFDGSHVLHANSDVMWFFMEVLPVIPKGVIIHIHDIFLPYDYPQWVCDRFFSEQYVFATYLLNSPSYRIIAPNYYLLTKKIGRASIDKVWEIPALATVKKQGRSFWFTKT